jgi:hypothetical protein
VATYKSAFDAQLAEANSALSNNGTALQSALPGMHYAHVRRLLTSISALLGRVDQGLHKHPEFLAGSPTIPNLAVQLVSSIKPNLDVGVDSFVQGVLPQLVDVEQRLTRAVGVGSYKVKDIKNLQIKAIDQMVDRAAVQQNAATQATKTISEQAAAVAERLAHIEEMAKQSEIDRKKVAEIRTMADRLARGNAGQNPLEKMVREARDRFDEITKLLDRASSSTKLSEDNAQASASARTEAEAKLAQLNKTNEQADAILKNATQAGLAGAYKIERDRLSKEKNTYAVAFYAGVVGIIAYAAIFIVPVFSAILEQDRDTNTKLGESTLLLLVRLAILAPAVWALIFTNRRHSNLETLEMDYAAKTATALAYSGYREEMEVDANLSGKLKNGLVVRFVEHPERLLRKNSLQETVGFGESGLTYSSSAVPAKAAEMAGTSPRVDSTDDA